MLDNVPIFRAKKKDSDEYVEGFLNIWEQGGNIYHSIMEFGVYPSPFNNIHIIDETTVAIHFPSMLGVNDVKIFASLQEDGKGGDILIEDGRYKDGFNPIFEPYFRKSSLSIFDLPETPYGEYQLKYYKIIGIQKEKLW